ncbi:MAG: (d)CMP kinase [Verrucomicrobia bacterium]|nr:MAG: (d)CMP kinase [Verrucomicrobiota bacterium]
MFPVIAIDGPAASGKSTVAQKIAAHLGITFVSSGELYRAVTWAALKADILPENGEKLDAFLRSAQISTQKLGDKVIFLIHGEGATQHLYDLEVNKNVSLFSQLPKFRAVLLEALRDLGNRFSLIMEGRDIGSVVFPATPYKFYLDASEKERERRRAAQGIADTITDRDQLDSTRKVAPLKIPPGACTLNTTEMSLDEVVRKVLEELKNKHFVIQHFTA